MSPGTANDSQLASLGATPNIQESSVEQPTYSSVDPHAASQTDRAGSVAPLQSEQNLQTTNNPTIAVIEDQKTEEIE